MEEQTYSLDQFAPHQQPPAACSALTTLSPHLAARRPAAPAAAPATPAGPAWGELPSDALAVIINDCGLAQSDVAAVRLTCRHWRHTSCCWLQSLSPACASLEQVADIAARFPYLTSVDLTRCDTRLVGHACLCRDASSRLAALLAALAAMPSLTALTLSDTFSERMGQKYWAASALLDHSDGVPAAGPAPGGEGQGQAAAGPGTASAPHQHQHQHHQHHQHNLPPPLPQPPHHGNRSSAAAAGGPAATAMPPATPPRASQPAAAEGSVLPPTPTSQAAANTHAAAATAAAAAGADASTSEPVHTDLLGAGALSEPLQRQPRQQQGHDPGQDRAHERQEPSEHGRQQEPEEEGEQLSGSPHAHSQPHLQQQDQAAVPGTPAPATPGPATPQQVPAASPADAAVSTASPTPSTPPAAAADHPMTTTSSSTPTRSTPPSDPDLLLTELMNDPGIKFGPLASLREVAVRGRQRPASGLPPCLLWLHAGRTAPQLTRLSLTRLGLATLPEQLRHLTALTRLVAQDCSLSLMPRGIAAGLSRLQHLDLSLNGLTSLPADFTCMTALEHLDLQRNKLAALPADLGRLTRLTCLLLCNNQLRQLPTSLSGLAGVQHLAASYNWLGGMAASLPLLCGLPRLRRLELACVSDVRCRLVPPQELQLLAGALTHLDLAANNLVPADVLGTLTSLRTLVLSDCGLLAVPPWVRRLAPCLSHLDLSTNSLSELPPWLPACGRLRFLSIAHNRLSLRVPPSVLEQMPQLRVVESE
eukprot:XP_001691643.1 hypothetical protein CHLREDRAFT_145348 [Chlamydomonas reinhardtii]